MVLPFIRWIVGLLCCFSLPLGAATLRVTTWNLGLEGSGPEVFLRLEHAAATLKVLHPDVILLQEVNNWRTCQALTEIMRPYEYTVLVCSAFPGPSTNAEAEPQVAILARSSAYFTWTEAWSDPQTPTGIQGGVVFAAVDAGPQKLAFFNALLAGKEHGKTEATLLLKQVESVKNWETNQVQTFVVAASAYSQVQSPGRTVRPTVTVLERAGLVDATETLTTDSHSTLNPATRETQTGDCLFVGPGGYPTLPQIVATPEFRHSPLTCDVDLDPQNVSLALDLRAEMRREHQVQVRRTLTIAGEITLGTLAILSAVGWWYRARSKRKQAAALARRAAMPVAPVPKPTSNTLRPVIFVERPEKPLPPAGLPTLGQPLPVKPALRIQSPERQRQPGLSPTPPPPKSEHTAPGEAVEPPRQTTFTPLNLPTADPAVRRGVVEELTKWLKQKFVRKLVSDREQLLQAHELATRMATTLDDRLARIEAQIQQQNDAYLRRIDELNRELAAAREENRELIRERIAQVKAEMEAARARVLAEANLSNDSLRL